MSTKLNFHPLLKLCKKEWKLSCTKDKITAWYQQNNEHVQAFYIKYSHKCLQVNVRFYLLFRIQKIWLVIIPKYFLAIFFTLITTNKQINSMEQSPSCKANSSSISQGIPAFYGTNRLITTFTTACLLSLSWARSIQSTTPHPTFIQIHFHAILPSMPRSSKWSLSLRFHHQTLYAPLLTHMRYMPPPISFFLIWPS